MKTEELAEIYAEVDDFLKDELEHFLQFLLDSHLLIESMDNTDWKKLIENYLSKTEKEVTR